MPTQKKQIQIKGKTMLGNVDLYPVTDTKVVYHNGMKLNEIIDDITHDTFAVEYIFKLSDEMPDIPESEGWGTVDGVPTQYSPTLDNWVPEGWSPVQTGVDREHPNEWACFRKKPRGGKTWSIFMGARPGEADDEPLLYSHYGINGTDGNGIEYAFVRTSKNVTPAVYGNDMYYIDSSGRPYTEDEHLPQVYVTGDCNIRGNRQTQEGSYKIAECTDDPKGVSRDYPFEWVIVRRMQEPDEHGTRVWNCYVGYMSVWANFSEDGSTPVFKYQWNNDPDNHPTPFDPNAQNPGAGWKDYVEDRPTSEGSWFLWATYAEKKPNGSYGTWCNPFRMTGDTGTAGEDGSDLEWIYKRFNAYPFPSSEPTPADIEYGQVSPQDSSAHGTETNKNLDDWVPNTWWDRALECTNTEKYVYASWRRKGVGDASWGDFAYPILWSNWGERGIDGDGIEYVYVRTKTNDAPEIQPDSTNPYSEDYQGYDYDEHKPYVMVDTSVDISGNNDASYIYQNKKYAMCTDDPVGVSEEWMYEWVLTRKKDNPDIDTHERSWRPYRGEMSLWAKWGEKGDTGEDANGREWIYRLDNSKPTIPDSSGTGTVHGVPTEYDDTIDDWVPLGWTDNPQGVSNSIKNEWACHRDSSNGHWGVFVGVDGTGYVDDEPSLWSHYGERGTDGDGVEYVFVRTQENVTPTLYGDDSHYQDSNGHYYTSDDHLPRVQVPSNSHISGHIPAQEDPITGAMYTECTDEPVGIDATWKHEWMIMRKMGVPVDGVRSWSYYTGTLSLWAKYSESGSTPIARYQWGENPSSPPEFYPNQENPGDDWTSYVPNRPQDEIVYLWQISAERKDGSIILPWGNAIRMTGDRGTPGEDGGDMEWIYKRYNVYPFPHNTSSDASRYPSEISAGEISPHGEADGSITNKDQDDWVPNTWWDEALDCSSNERYVYASYRHKGVGESTWGAFSVPVLWSNWGESGIDGDGVEYVYVRTKDDTKPRFFFSGSYTDSSGHTYLDDEFRPQTWVTNTHDIDGFGPVHQEESYKWVECTDDPKGCDSTWVYEWCASRKKTDPDDAGKRKWTKYTKIALWSKYGVDGRYPIYRYAWGDSSTSAPAYTPSATEPGAGWYDYVPNRIQENTYLWCINAMKNEDGTHDNWGNPVRLTGDKGTPGEDGEDTEWIYRRFDVYPYDETYQPKPKDVSEGQVSPGGEASGNDPDKNQRDWVPNGWYDEALPATELEKYVYAAWRRNNREDSSWGEFSDPMLWSNWGERGTDGDGLEYVFVRTKLYLTEQQSPMVVKDDTTFIDSSTKGYDKDEHRPAVGVTSSYDISGYTDPSTCQVSGTTYKWVEATDDPVGVDSTWKYEWVLTRKKKAPENGEREWNPYTGHVKLWAKWSDDGGTPEYRYQWSDSSQTCPDYYNDDGDPMYPPTGETPPGSAWSPNIPDRVTGKPYLWLISASRDSGGQVGKWGNPVRLTGEQGTPGEDGDDLEWIYKAFNVYPFPHNSSTEPYPSEIVYGEISPHGAAGHVTDSSLTPDWVPTTWYDEALATDPSTAKFVYASYRKGHDNEWTAFSEPILWSNYGERGIDGDGVEYVFVRTKSVTTAPTVPTDSSWGEDNNNYNTDDHKPYVYVPEGIEISGYNTPVTQNNNTYVLATDDPVGVSETWQYEWVLKRSKGSPVDGVRSWNKYSGAMSIWARYSKDAAQIGSNILFRTIFDDKDLNFVKQAWTLYNGSWTSTNVAIDNNVTVEGRSSLRLKSTASSGSSAYIDLKQSVKNRIKGNTWYTLSFYACCAENDYNVYLYTANIAKLYTDEQIIVDGVARIPSGSNNGCIVFESGATMTRHTMSFKTPATIPSTAEIMFRAFNGKNLYICMPKLEMGDTATAYIPYEGDLTGERGVSVSNIIELYTISDSSTVAPGPTYNWTDYVRPSTDENPWVWNKEKVIYSDDSSTFTTPQLMGKEVASILEQYAVWDNGIDYSGIPDSSWGSYDDIAQYFVVGKYLWNREIVTYTASSGYSPTITEPCCIGHIAQGEVAVQNYITSSQVSIIRKTDGTYNVNSVTLTGWKKSGNSEPEQLSSTDGFTISAIQYAGSTAGTTTSSGTGSVTISSFDNDADRIEVSMRKSNILYAVYTVSIITEQEGKDAAEVQPNIFMDANFNEGIATGIAINQGWWDIHAEKVQGMDGKRAMYYNNASGSDPVVLMNQSIYKDGFVDRIQPSTWYTLSFWAKGTRVNIQIYGEDSYHVIDTSQYWYVDGVAGTPPINGDTTFILSLAWTYHTITFKTKSTVISDGREKKIRFRVPSGYNATICMPKLERGTSGTAFSLNPEESSERATSYMGEWSDSAVYTGTGSVRQIVEYNSIYYMTMRTAGEVTGNNINPTNSWYWKRFDAQFENVATNLLLAREIYVDKLGVRLLKTSEGTGKRIAIEGNEFMVFDSSNNMKLKISGDEISGSGNSQSTAVLTDTSTGSTNNSVLTVYNEYTIWEFDVVASNNTLRIPQIDINIDASIQSISYVPTFITEAAIFLDDTTIFYSHDSGSQGTNTDHLYRNYTALNTFRTLGVGHHSITCNVSIQLYMEQGYGTSHKKWAITIKPHIPGARINLDYTQYVLEIGSNGIKGIFGTTQKMVQFTQSNGSFNITLQNGNNGIILTESNMQMVLGGSKYNVSRNSSGYLTTTLAT